MIQGIAHTAFATADMKATLHFYCDQLGLKHAFSIPDDDGNPWIEYVKAGPGMFIEFFYAKPDERLENGSFRHLCLAADDIQALAGHLTAKGVPLRVPPQQGKDGNWQCWIDDPDGNPIELMQISPDSPQARA